MAKRILAMQESDLRMDGDLAMNIQRVLPVTQADIDAAAAVGQGWVVEQVFEVSLPIDNTVGQTWRVIKVNSITPGQNVKRVMIVPNPHQKTIVVSGIPPLQLLGAVEDSLSELKAYGGLLQGGVPGGYTAVEYVENAASTMVKTAIHIGNDDNFKIDITATAVAGSFYLFQARDKVNSSLGNANITGISGATSGNTLLGSPGIDGVSVSNGLTRANRTGHKMRFVLDIADGDMSWYVRDLDGNVENTATGTYDPTQLNRATTNMCIYGNEAPAGSGAGQTANRLQSGCKVYGAKLWKNGVLVLDYVPATRDSDSAVGFYDRISHTFITATDGSLTAGSSLAPTPSDPVDLVCNNGKISVLDHTNWNVITNPTSQPGQGMFINSDGKLQKAGDRGAGVFIPVTVGKQYTLLINKKNTALGSIIRYGQSDNGTVPNNAEQLLDWYRGEIKVMMMISFTAKRPYFVMQLAASLVEAGGIDEAVEVIEAAGDNETIAIRTRNLANVATDIDGYYIGADGTITASANSCYSDIIPVVAGKTYTWSGICGGSSYNNKRVHAYIDGVWNQQVAYEQVTAQTPFTITFTVPAGCNGIRISHFNDDTNTQVEVGPTKTNYIAYNDSMATANNLFNLNTYQDVQEIITGATTHKCGIKVFDGTETFLDTGVNGCYSWVSDFIKTVSDDPNRLLFCTHFWGIDSNTLPDTYTDRQGGVFKTTPTNDPTAGISFGVMATYATVAAFQSFLASQYAAGTPVIVVYPLATPYEEPAPVPQTMQTVAGDNVLDIVQAGMSGLEVEATYTAGVSVTITEIQNANIGNEVDVVIA